ncbi:MAG TPA: DUF6527 family protein [Rhizomicrobium sp.]|jgi:hypothetical protein|nr:DUF6527 family protein [Rhizomicrobium sp.]
MATPPDRTEAPPRRASYKHVFVDVLPDSLDEGVLYVCIQYATCAHKCFCGCGREVVTPIHPTKWRLTFDGKQVSLFPSVGSWSLPCQSHYWLKGGRVLWSGRMSEERIQAVRRRDLTAQDSYFAKKDEPPTQINEPAPQPTSRWRKMANWFEEK